MEGGRRGRKGEEEVEVGVKRKGVKRETLEV